MIIKCFILTNQHLKKWSQPLFRSTNCNKLQLQIAANCPDVIKSEHVSNKVKRCAISFRTNFIKGINKQTNNQTKEAHNP